MSKRIAKEFAELQKQPPEDMKVDLISETDLFKWVITITGPKDTPYAGGKFEVHATLPNQYPFKPPVINWKTKIYHPNVTNDGKGTMCLGFLRDGEWKPSSRMGTALEYVRQLMLDPVPEDAVEQAVANEYNNNKKQFIKTAKLWTKTDGNDGPWSTFACRVGTPPQTVRVLASTAVPETWVVSTGGCIATDPADCPDSRGVVFSPNASSTWDNVGNFALNVEKNLRNYSSNWDNGNYGFDTLSLGYLGSGGPTVETSVIAGLNTKDFYLGSIGLSSQPLNFTATDNPAPSLLGNLKTRNQIPSLSYGYSAGAPYRLKKVLGSLTLGGYDASRRPPNDTIAPFTLGDDISRDLLVGLQSIEYSDARTTGRRLLSEGILTFIDSTVPHIWLPLEACRAFESVFGLTHDNTTDLYLVNSTLHDTLSQENASISFVLGNRVQGGETVNITFPYASLDLQVSSPIVPEPTRYFPLRRADNETQYTLGRTFLQESYLTVDYERSRFSVHQATFEDGAVPNLIPINSPTGPSSDAVMSNRGSDGFPRGALAGTVAGAVTLCFLIIGALCLLFWKRRRRRSIQAGSEQVGAKEAETASGSSTNITGGELNNEFGDGQYRPPEVEGSFGSRGKLVEAEGNHGAIEMEGTDGGAELHGSGGVAEMEAKGPTAELDAVHVYELPAGEVKAKVPRSESGQERIRIARLARPRKKEQRNE